MKIVLLSLHITDIFQMTLSLRCTLFFNQQETKYVSMYLNADLKTQVAIGSSSSHVVLNGIQWFILATFEINIPKKELHELGESRYTLSVYCGRYRRMTSENSQVCLRKRIAQLIDLASSCIDRQVFKF